MESLETSKQALSEIKKASVYDNILNYISIIENTNKIMKSNNNNICNNTIETSCRKIKDIINCDVNNKLTCDANQIFDPMEKISKIINNYQKILNAKDIEINIINENNNNIIINNNEVLFDRLIYNIIKTISKQTQQTQINIFLSHNYPYLMIKITSEKFISLNEKLIKDTMKQIEGDYIKDLFDKSINFIFNIPIHSKLANNAF